MPSGSFDLRLRALLLLTLGFGCVSPRYIGSIGRDRTYSNRGYGLAVRLTEGGLIERWAPVEPDRLHRAPSRARPLSLSDPIDLDGDGRLDLTERTQRQRPVLRLLHRAKPSAWLDLDVKILGGPERGASLDAVVASQIRPMVGTSSSALSQALNGVKTVKVQDQQGGAFEARVAELTSKDGRFARLAVIDQRRFRAEEGILRRQIVKVTLWTKSKDEALNKDHALFMRSVLLTRAGGRATTKENW